MIFLVQYNINAMSTCKNIVISAHIMYISFQLCIIAYSAHV
jgi:hypothetical protein